MCVQNTVCVCVGERGVSEREEEGVCVCVRERESEGGACNVNLLQDINIEGIYKVTGAGILGER